MQQRELRAWHAEHGIATEAWSPLAQGAVLDDETIAAVADSHGKTPAQAILRWHLQLGNVVIPKSVTPERIRENFDLFDFELSGEEMAAIERARPRQPDRPRPSHLRSALILGPSGVPTQAASREFLSRDPRRPPRRRSSST